MTCTAPPQSDAARSSSRTKASSSALVFGDLSVTVLFSIAMRRRLNAGLFFCTSRTPVPRTRCTTPPRSARRRKVFAANSEPGRRRPTGRRLPALGHGYQALALGQFPGSLARAPDGFRLLAGLALGWFLIRLATLHLTKNALSLHLLLEHPESLIDIVVSNEYLQNVSNLLLALDAPSSC